MEKLDLSKTYKSYYSSKAEPELVQVEKAQFLTIEGTGDPSGKEFAASLEALYSVVYTVKFMCKWDGRDFVVPKLEGLWSYDTEVYKNVIPEEAPLKIPRSSWQYTLLLRLPEYVDARQTELAVQQVLEKKKLPGAENVKFRSLHEGKCVQMLHAGPFDKEPGTLKQLHVFMDAKGLAWNGRHHEIYLSDFRRTAPEKLKTILRQPVK